MRWKRLIYCSRATVSMENTLNISEILGASFRNNRRDGITGVLAYADGMFIHAVEGQPNAVDNLLTRIRSDKRHRDISVLGEESVSQRAFGVWTMETPKIRPERTDMIRALIEGCEGPYPKALKLMLEMADEGVGD